MRRSRLLLIPVLISTVLALSGSPVEARDAPLGPRWTVPMAELRDASVVALHDGGDLLLVEDSRHGLTALDAETGDVRWFVLTAGYLDQPPVRHEELLVLTSGDWLLVVDAVNGRRLVQRVLDAVPPLAPIASEPMLYLAQTLSGRVSAIHLDDGRERWHIDLPGGVVQPLRRVGSTGPLVAACGDGTLRGLPTGPGVPAGESWVAHTGWLAGPLVVGSDWMLSVGLDRRVMMRHGAGGKLIWQALLDSDPTGSACVAAGVLAVSAQSGARVFDRATGELSWTADGEALVGSTGEALCLEDGAGGLLLRRASDGALIASGLAGNVQVTAGGLFVVDDGRVTRLDAD
ncbi:MAG: hypothetical protein DRQ55_07290 [Planctomycetota bacterium]|nr:MAG: hypothetical protein DRQ55_07290 [Planctomycetota bacterium]